MQRPRNLRARSWLVACTTSWLCLSGCGGSEFVSGNASGGSDTSGSGSGGSDTSGTTSGGSGGAANGGKAGVASAGDSTSAGAPDPGGTGGTGDTGGMVSTTCDCPVGHYCRNGSTDCFDCAALNSLHFAAPERLAALSDLGTASRFPRVGATSTDLFYHSAGVGVRYTTDASTSVGSNIKGTVQTDSAPLLLRSEVTGTTGLMMLMSFNFAFDRIGTAGRRQLFVGEWKNGLGAVEQLLPPFDGGKGDFSMAVAPHVTPDNVARGFWMTAGDATNMTAGPTLVTALFAGAAVAAPVVLNIGSAPCPPKDPKTDADLTPWVTDDGKLLLISTTRMDNCVLGSAGKDIYAALLDPTTGQPTAAAVPMSDVNSGMDDVDPSFSADMCDLYFSSNRDGKYGLYRAHRR